MYYPKPGKPIDELLIKLERHKNNRRWANHFFYTLVLNDKKLNSIQMEKLFFIVLESKNLEWAHSFSKMEHATESQIDQLISFFEKSPEDKLSAYCFAHVVEKLTQKQMDRLI